MSIRDLLAEADVEFGLKPIKLRVKANRMRQTIVIRAFAGTKRVGFLTAYGGMEGIDIDQVFIDKAWQRMGVGTELYRRAAKEACKMGQPLRSMDDQRSKVTASKFWAQEPKAKRGTRTQHNGVVQKFWYYPCP